MMKTLPIFSTLIALAAAIPASAADRPNILFCFSDDWGREHLPASGPTAQVVVPEEIEILTTLS